MTDVFFVTLTVAFFALCIAYVRACDRIVSRPAESGEEPAPELVNESVVSER